MPFCFSGIAEHAQSCIAVRAVTVRYERLLMGGHGFDALKERS